MTTRREQGSAPDAELIEESFVSEPEGERAPLHIPPADRKLVTHPYDFIVTSLKVQIDDSTLVLADKFQRRRVWDDAKASRLIESLMLNVPIPVCYFAELENGAYSVIDGQQRLTAIYRFLNNEFSLRGLRIRPELNKKRHFELDKVDQRLISSRALRCIVILRESHPDIRFDIFERLNTGSVRLNQQELRNSTYRGPMNDLLRTLSEHEMFMEARDVSSIDKRMQDCELILRFWAFHYRMESYRGDFASFLDAYLSEGNKFGDAELLTHSEMFIDTIAKVLAVFGDSAFRRWGGPQGGWETQVNRAIYDVIMLSFARIPAKEIVQHHDRIVAALQSLSSDRAFLDAVSSSTKDRRRVQERLNLWRQAMLDIGIAVEPFQVGRAT
jgi:hypothetical protein